MSVELKEFGGACFPKDKALKKNPELKPLAILIKALNKGIAEAVIFGKLAAEHPEHIDDYFKVKIWEHREDLPCPELDVLSPDFFGSSVVWNVNAGEPAAAPQPEDDENQNHSDDRQAEEMKSVRLLDQHSRAACLALFGPVEEITAAQYGQIVDLINDDQSSFEQHLAEALTKETRALALAPERQQRTESGATLGGNNQTDRSPNMVHNIATLKIEVAIGILSLYDEIDIYAIPSRFLIPAKAMAEAEEDSRFTTWWKQLHGTPGILDYSRAAIIALIKSTPEVLWLKPVELREHINRELIESDHANPDQKTIDIACSAAPRNIPEAQNEKTQQVHDNKTEIPAVCPARAAELDKELNDAFEQTSEQLAAGRGEFVPGISDPSDPKWIDGSTQPKIENIGGGVYSVDALMGQQPSNEVEKQEVPPVLCDRDIEIAHALNDLISGRTNIMNKEEAECVVTYTGHTITDVLPLLIADITTTEFCLSPDFDDDEIHNVATDILDAWSDDLNVRQKVALDGIVEYRRPISPKSSAPVISTQSSSDTQPEQLSAPALITLTYQQQLTLAALQGLCANPAYSAISDELPEMAFRMARAIITEEAAQ